MSKKCKNKFKKLKKVTIEKDFENKTLNLEEPLSTMAIKFAKEYVFSDDLNGANAAIRAGYSAKTARSIASNLKRDPRVQALINEQIEYLFQDIELKKKFLLNRMFEIVTSDITEYIDIQNIETKKGKQTITVSNLCLKDIFKLPPAKRQLIKSISQGKAGIKIELEDKIAAATFLGKNFQLFGDSENPGDVFNTQVNIYIPSNGRDEKK